MVDESDRHRLKVGSAEKVSTRCRVRGPADRRLLTIRRDTYAETSGGSGMVGRGALPDRPSLLEDRVAVGEVEEGVESIRKIDRPQP
jgi:hypothetical protein